MNNSEKKAPKVNNVTQATFHYLKTHPFYYVLILLLLFIGIILTVRTSVPHFFVFSVVGIFLIFGIVSNQMRGHMMEQFAKNLNYNFEKEGDLSTVSGSLFNIGHSKKIINVISGRDADDHLVRIFLYQYTVGSGKNSHTYHFTIFENTFNGQMPHILLHEKYFLSDIIPDFAGGDHIELEGDFNKHFSLSVEKEFEIEALQIFTPDFMEKLIKIAKKFSFEFFQNKLYIYMKKKISSRTELEVMFDLSNKLCTHLKPVVKDIDDDVSALRQVMSN